MYSVGCISSQSTHGEGGDFMPEAIDEDEGEEEENAILNFYHYISRKTFER